MRKYKKKTVIIKEEKVKNCRQKHVIIYEDGF